MKGGKITVLRLSRALESFGKDRFQKGARVIDKFLQASQLY
jgi:hypothetical protein